MYFPRHIEQVVAKTAQTFAAVVVTGPRQVGKTTLLQHVYPHATYTTFDQLDVYEAARNDPERFLSTQSEPVIIDEVQYVPQLFRSVKLAADKKKGEKGRFFLTGSQRYVMMQGVDESMAGRAGTVEMLGLSAREIAQSDFKEVFLPTASFLQRRKESLQKQDLLQTQDPPQNPDYANTSVWDVMFRGDLPELHAEPTMDTVRYYDSYIDTYLRRDVRDLSHVGDLSKFNRFMALVALSHGKILNKSDLASKADISFQTADKWLSVLEASNIIYLLKPFFANAKKRLIKSPKLYFLNSGLAARLRGFQAATDLENSFDSGEFFEGFVLGEILKSHLNAKGTFPDLYYYRDSNRNEIDFIVVDGFNLYPVEVKSARRVRLSDTKAFKYLDEFKEYQRLEGAVVCQGSEVLPLGNNSWTIPVSYL